MDEYLIYIALGVLVIIVVVTLYLLINNKKKSDIDNIDTQSILSIIDKDNVLKVEYIRNKIVINFKDVNLFDTKKLHSLGVKGITIVGDKIKFYVDTKNEVNENIYKSIKEFVEGKW